MKSRTPLFLALFIVFTFCGRKGPDENTLKEKISNFTDSYWNNKDINSLEELSTDNFLRKINNVTVANGLNEAEANSNVFFKAFPDLQIANTNTYIKGDHAFVNWILTGTNIGTFGEIEPTGKKVRISGISHLYFDNAGKIFQEDIYYNELDMLQQLGYTLNAPVVE